MSSGGSGGGAHHKLVMVGGDVSEPASNEDPNAELQGSEADGGGEADADDSE